MSKFFFVKNFFFEIFIFSKFFLTIIFKLNIEYGFLDLPTFVTIRPNSGFGTILPNEELNLELVFSAPEAGEYAFEIVFQTIRGFRATIECTAIGVRTALVLSDQYINFNTGIYPYIVFKYLTGIL